MLNLSLLGCLEVVVSWLETNKKKQFFFNISFSWVELSLHAEFEPRGLPRSGSFMVGDNKTTTTSFNEINSFLSLQLELRLELGLRLRLTKKGLGPTFFKKHMDLFPHQHQGAGAEFF